MSIPTVPATVPLSVVVHQLPETTDRKCHSCGSPIQDSRNALGVYTHELNKDDWHWYEFCDSDCVTLACRAGNG